ncbi:MAG: hypothetical protein Q8R83_03875 [Legionellaceae bacterium]|nr:hypothetical protein [Legionellaceae bacterium]
MRENGYGRSTMNDQILLLEEFLQGKNWHELPKPLLLASVKNGGITVFLVQKILFIIEMGYSNEKNKDW